MGMKCNDCGKRVKNKEGVIFDQCHKCEEVFCESCKSCCTKIDTSP